MTIEYFEILDKCIRRNKMYFNALDLKMAYEIYFKFVSENHELCLVEKDLNSEIKLFKIRPKYKKSIEQIIECYNNLEKNVDRSDLEIYFKYINYIIDHNSIESRNMVRSLRKHLKFKLKNDEVH